MSAPAEPDLVDAYLAHHFAFRPVDASFMGLAEHDARLPDASAGAAGLERQGLAALQARLDRSIEPAALGARLDRRYVQAQVRLCAAALDATPRFANPAWYTGEAAFGIISLLLPQTASDRREAVAARLVALPDFLSDGRAQLAGGAAPRAVVARARREAAAAADVLREDIVSHPDWREAWSPPALQAAAAFDAFAEAIADLPDRTGACGRAHLELLMREGHGLSWDAAAAVSKAEADFDRLGEELVEMAAALDPSRSWSAQVEALAGIGVGAPEAVVARCRELDARALAGGGGLVTTAVDYALEYRWLAPCFDRVAKALYFLPYRSPPAEGAGEGSVYWVQPPSGEPAAYLRAYADMALKVIHAVHHGSVGHHTQNARARGAASRLARLAGTDCALGIAMLGSGSMVEGWACYAQDLMQEVPGFYTPAERLFLKSLERRNAASVLVDIRLHTGEWSAGEAMAFYADEAGFAPARVEGEVTRNLMLPATRLMYWLGVEQIRDLRARWRGDARSFHDILIGYGHVPVAWAGEEMARAGLLA